MISEDLIQQFVKETELFEERSRPSSPEKLTGKLLKVFSGPVWLLCPEGEKLYARLRFPGGRISKNIWLSWGKDKRISPGA